MKASILSKLESLVERYEEVQHLLGDPTVIGDQNKFRALSKEYSQLEEITQCFQAYQQAKEDLVAAEEMAQEDDAEMREMAQDEIKAAKAAIERLTDELQILLLPKDPNDDRNCFLEIRAGAGGDEAGIFAGDLFRMYSRFAEKKGWRIEVMSSSEGTRRLQRDDRESER
ncbi:peptide chain release factor RF-1 [Vibrio cholerae]|nr:peptide chain release factor RF-1 [Vibrio cholerae]